MEYVLDQTLEFPDGSYVDNSEPLIKFFAEDCERRGISAAQFNELVRQMGEELRKHFQRTKQYIRGEEVPSLARRLRDLAAGAGVPVEDASALAETMARHFILRAGLSDVPRDLL